ncbi:AfsR/SARP family transcriptional regulator [Micromonospora sp. NPDC004704]
MELRLLGPVEVWTDGGLLDAGPPRQRAVLAALAVDVGRTVSTDALMGRLWGTAPPQRGRHTLHVYIARIRQLLARADAPATLVRRSGGYLLETEAGRVDVHRFEALVAQAATARLPDDRRALLLRQALRLWRGEALADLSGDWVDQVRQTWQRRHLDAVLSWARAELRIGNPDGVIGQLTELTAAHPLVEPLSATLMRALVAAGRGAEALDHYSLVRGRLADELGADPGPELRDLHRAILRGTIGTAAPANAPMSPAPARPAQLPADLPDFVGRAALVTRLVATLRPSGGNPAVAAITGMAGVGKTSLALHVAHLLRTDYPDGQLFADLRGIQAEPVDPIRVVGAFLRALGVPPPGVPTDPAERTGLWRSLLSDRAVLVLLDNVRDAGTILSLLPGTGPVAVLVTSREPLTGLPATIAVDLDVFDRDESLDLLRAVSGAGRVAADPAAAAEVIDACGRLPLAVRLAASRLAARPHWTAADLAARLAAGHRRLEELRVADQEVRASLELSYRALSTAGATAFRHLSRAELGELSVDVVAAMLDVDPTTAAGIAEELVDTRLLGSPRSGRYRYHDLVQLFAQEKSGHDDPDGITDVLIRRLVEAYRISVLDAQQAGQGNPAGRFPDADQARRWLAGECHLVVAAVLRAVRSRATVDPAVLTDIATALGPYLRASGEWDEGHRLAYAILELAERDGDPATELLARMPLGQLATLRSDFDEAGTQLSRASALAHDLGDVRAEAQVLNLLGLLLFCQARPVAAIEVHEASLKLFSDLDDPTGCMAARINLAKCLATQGRGAEGLSVVATAENLLQPGDDGSRTMLLHQKARCQSATGRYDEALDTHQRCLTLVRRHGMREGEAYVLAELGVTLLDAGAAEEARAHLRTAVERFDELGDRNAADSYRVMLGLAYRALGDLDAARAAWRRAIDLS